MKKTFLIIALLFALPLAAQDTVFSHLPSGKYLYNWWFEQDMDIMKGNMSLLELSGDKVIGVGFHTDKPVEVYGIAAALATYDIEYFGSRVYDMDGTFLYIDSSFYYASMLDMCDTVAEEAYEYWGIYKRDADSIRLVSPQLLINIKTSPMAYYWDLGVHSANPYWGEFLHPIPMYEMYFNHSHTVEDSFFLATTNRIMLRPQFGGDECIYRSWPIFWVVFDGTFPQTFVWYEHHYFPDIPGGIPSDTGSGRWIFQSPTPSLNFIYPILEPNRDGYHGEVDPDTTSTGDTTGVGIGSDNRLLWSTSVVLPNPACTEARVVCGVPMSLVEAFDGSGNRYATLRPEGNEAVVDVSTWPSGLYLLRLTTPLGTVTKRLVVQH